MSAPQLIYKMLQALNLPLGFFSLHTLTTSSVARSLIGSDSLLLLTCSLVALLRDSPARSLSLFTNGVIKNAQAVTLAGCQGGGVCLLAGAFLFSALLC